MQQPSIRQATTADLDTLVAHRRAMFVDMGYQDAASLDSMSVAFRPWLSARMESGEYLAWVATKGDGAIVAGLGLWLMDWPPHMIGPGARRGNILNVYTEAAYRRQGIARRLMDAALAWCHNSGIRAVILHASNDGRPLYEKLGFQPTNEMRIVVE